MIEYTTLSEILDKARSLPIILEGLNLPYSPNHKGQTTTEHIQKQIEMADVLSRVASLINQDTTLKQTQNDLDAVEQLLDRDYDSLQKMISNENVKEKPHLFVEKEDLQAFFDPLLEDLTMSDLKTLVAIVATHDFGKLDPTWAKQKLDLTHVDFIAHDYDSRKILENNPSLLSMFELNLGETALTLDLVKLHSLPGQYFFGEGNLAGYQPVLDYSRARDSDNPLKIARIHGLIDVMSALNQGFVKPILNSHIKMSNAIDTVYHQGSRLGEAFVEEAVLATKDLEDVMKTFGILPNAMYRLMKLTNTSPSEKNIIQEAFAETDYSFLKEFNRATAGEATWFGTYIANAFGSGLKRSYGEMITDTDKKLVLQTTMRAISVASDFHSQFGDSSYALSSVTPGLMVNEGTTEPIISSFFKHDTLQEMSSYLNNKKEGLYLRGANDAVEIGHYEIQKPN